jgi:hypothetical protein
MECRGDDPGGLSSTPSLPKGNLFRLGNMIVFGREGNFLRFERRRQLKIISPIE